MNFLSFLWERYSGNIIQFMLLCVMLGMVAISVGIYYCDRDWTVLLIPLLGLGCFLHLDWKSYKAGSRP